MRENVRYNSFAVSANARLGIKKGNLPPDARQVLELRAPSAQWEAIAKVVREMDNLGRDVERARWTAEWAESNFN